ncbi:sensor histidine kinase [Streptomyces sp. TRM66268-LWL]|uniref:Oxygen sensor histidine kinase NreB n=1 Tax=Streptomyces polyasparticus TaxID=2767826 RepID=A0ABR7SNG3_9ACTN|nr:sensor histidine kinase [Streptomyces polyasparticus]MBC9715883.1 sensor histidine kinase [Streptomyces polyasparticus]
MNAAAPPLAPTSRALTWCLHLLVVGLLALAAVRAVVDSRPHAGLVVAAAAACGLGYAAGQLLPGVRSSRRAAAWWLAGVGVLWLLLLVLTADGIWLAFPLYFLQLHLLPRRAGLTAVIATAVASIAAFSAHQGSFTAAMAIGPALGAAVAVAVVWGYQALYRESDQRRQLIEELTATRADLAAAQHTAGVLAERERLAREIHDTLAQGLSSIQLLLRAAERALPGTPDTAARYVDQARRAAVDNLAEARRFVAALAPPSLDGSTLASALERLCAGTGSDDGLTARFHLTGTPVPLPTAHEVALLRIAQSALANTVRHAAATTADITLGYDGGHVGLSVVDDGAGFDPARLPLPDPEFGGFGLAAMRARMRALGGTFTLASAPGEGTALTARLPLAVSTGVEPSAPTVTEPEDRS